MKVIEVRDSADARRFMVQSLWTQRVLAPRANTVWQTLEWGLELLSTGEPLPSLGFIADVGHLVFGQGHEDRKSQYTENLPEIPEGRVRKYEDYVLGKLYADWTFERAGDALRRYQDKRDRARGLAFLLTQLRQRSGTSGIQFSPAILKSLLEVKPEDILNEGWEDILNQGWDESLCALMDDMVITVRNAAHVLGSEDIFELEHGTALARFSQRVALRQVLQATDLFEQSLPKIKPRTIVRRYEVPTRVLDEDTYPVGGFSSISTRGSIESLLHSQLAYMEPESSEQPDLFDIKFLRDELLYYARDENQFLRRRRTYVFAFAPALAHARFKDPRLPFQRWVLLLGMLRAAVRRLMEWLSTDSLHFDFLLIEGDQREFLSSSEKLLKMLYREEVANGTVKLEVIPDGRLASWCRQRARRSLCQVLLMGMEECGVSGDQAVVARLHLDNPRPALGIRDERCTLRDADDDLGAWTAVLQELLVLWT